MDATFENRTEGLLPITAQTGTLISFNVEPMYSTAENLQNAVLKHGSRHGGSYLLSLIFIAFVISLFRFINKAENRAAAEHKEESRPAPKASAKPAPAPVPEAVPEPMDDLELVARDHRSCSCIHEYICG